MTRFFLKIITVLFILFSSGIIQSQEAIKFKPNFKNFTVNDGLPSNQLYEIMEDHMGFIWIGTDRGLVRWDGYDFQTFTVNDGLTSNVIFHVVEDEDHVIWVMGYDKKILKLYNQSFSLNPIIKEFQHNEKVADNIQPNAKTLSIHPDPNGIKINLSASFTTHGFYISNEGTKIESPKLPGTHIQLNFSDPRISYFPNINDPFIVDNLYVNEEKVEFESIPANALTSRIIEISGIHFFSIYNYLLSHNDGETSIIHVFDNEIIELGLNNNGKLLIGMYNDGLFEYDIRKNEMNQLIENLYVSAIFLDKNGNLWIGTLFNGLFISPSNSGIVSLENYSIILTKGNNHQICIADENFNLYKIKDNEVEKFSYRPKAILKGGSDITSSDILFCCIDYESNGMSAPLARIDSTGELSTSRILRAQYLKTDSSIFIYNSIGFLKYSHSEFEKIPKHFESSVHKETTMKKGRIKFEGARINACEFYSNKLFIATNKGIYVEQAHENTLEPFLPDLDFMRHPMNSVVSNDSNLFFISKNHGVGMITNDSINVINKKNGLVSSSLNGGFAYKNNLAVWSNKGFSIIDKDLKIQNYDISSGLLSNFIHDVFIRNDTAWIGTDKGLNILPLRRETLQPSIPTYLTSIKSEKQDYTGLKTFTLPSTSDYLNINYTAVSYTHNGDIEYRYKMSDHHSDWVYTDSRQVNISGISAGEHEFSISVLNAGKWTEPVKLFSIHKKEVFYKTLWFYFLTLSLALFTIYLVYLNRLKRQANLHDMDMLISDLERKALQSQMNPHFIFNSLASLQSLILDNKKSEAHDYLINFSRLARLVLNHSAQKEVLLAKEIELLEHYIYLEKLRFGDVFTHKLEIDEHLLQEALIPPMIIQPIIENAILHGLAPLGENGKLDLKISYYNEHLLCCEIQDNGIGLKDSKDPNGHISKGMSIIKQRLSLISDNAEIYIKPNPKYGVTVRIKLPYTKIYNDNTDS